VLHEASLEVAEGERIGLIGASGSGKTTLVRCGLGLVRADGGRIALFGRDTAGWSGRDWRGARHEVQLLLQDPRAMLHPELTIRALLEESAALHRPEADPAAAAAEVLQSVGLGARADALPRELSGGERRRAGIARVLLARPRLLVADEPTAGLDAVLKRRMVDRIVEAAGPGCAIVLVTHDLAAVAPVCDRIAVMHGGRVIETFPAAALGAGFEPALRTTALLLAASGFPSGSTLSGAGAVRSVHGGG
jgi:ABC-type glutathione transport system ATPase component